jgi:hypothetical protein
MKTLIMCKLNLLERKLDKHNNKMMLQSVKDLNIKLDILKAGSSILGSRPGANADADPMHHFGEAGRWALTVATSSIVRQRRMRRHCETVLNSDKNASSPRQSANCNVPDDQAVV